MLWAWGTLYKEKATIPTIEAVLMDGIKKRLCFANMRVQCFRVGEDIRVNMIFSRPLQRSAVWETWEKGTGKYDVHYYVGELANSLVIHGVGNSHDGTGPMDVCPGVQACL